MAVSLTSPAFQDGDFIPRQFTCDGDNLPPPLRWSDGPAGTRSYVLMVEDQDAGDDTFTHWVLYDIPPQATQWPGECGGKTMANGFGRSGYSGPCPPAGGGPHHYVFSIYAVDVRYLEVGDGRVDALRLALEGHAIATGRLIGRYER